MHVIKAPKKKVVKIIKPKDKGKKDVKFGD